MTKKFLFIVDPLEGLNINTDTTLAFIEEASKRGIQCYASLISDISLRNGVVHFLAGRVFLAKGYSEPPSYLDEKRVYSCHEFSMVFMRKDPPVDQAFLSALFMLRCYDAKKTIMVNEPDGLLIANEKLFGLKAFSRFFPVTMVSSNLQDMRAFLRAHKKIVLKPLYGAGGSGVLVFEDEDMNFNSAAELLTKNFSLPVIIQSFIPKAREGDKRILLLGGDPLGAVLRVPHLKEHRANFHAGGQALKAVVTERELEIISELKPALIKMGLHFVGIDVIDGFITEINVTSPTCLIEIEHLDKTDLRKKVLDYLENLSLGRH